LDTSVDHSRESVRIEAVETLKAKVSRIRKRDGRIVSFDGTKITNAIFKAAEAVGEHDRSVVESLSRRVVEVINKNYNERSVPMVEQIQDVVEDVLIEAGHA
jgi:anaerobic ribonucleoside-triphosphate reductase